MRYITIGAVVGVYALKGEIKVKPLLYDSAIFSNMKEVHVKFKDGTQKKAIIERSRNHSEFWLLKFLGCDSANEAMLYKGCTLIAPETVLPKLTSDEIYWINIEGSQVYDELGAYLGLLVDFIPAGSFDVFIIKDSDSRSEYLINNNPHHVISIDEVEKKIVVNRVGLVDSFEKV